MYDATCHASCRLSRSNLMLTRMTTRFVLGDCVPNTSHPPYIYINRDLECGHIAARHRALNHNTPSEGDGKRLIWFGKPFGDGFFTVSSEPHDELGNFVYPVTKLCVRARVCVFYQCHIPVSAHNRRRLIRGQVE
ncbi:hypothetical protein LSH36_10g14002 [Paralvinella palmiformis]|uniref:Uncharacterized protein n=1 Tax=Paralvinella palmiformis TaxID=53620 RepID=A0AAD9KDW2_9ANNE|nr:hypothetical protein LSH36_10g14002 [Paralvinella palmiformis]